MVLSLDMKEFIPAKIESGILGNSYPTSIMLENDYYNISYESPVSNHTKKIVGSRHHSHKFPNQLLLDEKSFEILGLLQGEMSKTHRRPITFANSQPDVVRKVISWLEVNLEIPSSSWHWYIKLNIPEPNDRIRNELENELVPFWMLCCEIDYSMRYPKTLSFIAKSERDYLINDGTLIIERRGPIIVQTMQLLVKIITRDILTFPDWAIRSYIRGIIAAESTINYKLESGHRRVFITATDNKERGIFIRCLERLGILSYDCKPIKDIVISRKENLRKLHELDLMSLNPEKHEKFRRMIGSYEEFETSKPL